MTPRFRSQLSWALNSWANHAFATTVLVGFFPIFFDRYWAQGVAGTTSTFYLGVTNSVASFVVMLIAPWLGALADRRGWKKRFLAIFTAIGVVATATLFFIGQGQWPWAAVVFAVASIGFFGGSSFSDALLVQVAEPRETDRVSAFGYALGYLGGGLLFVLNVLMVLHPAWFGLADATIATRISFLTVAIWWALFALPQFRYVQEPAAIAETAGWRELWQTMKRVMANRPVRNFLLAYWLYIDALGTLQQMAVDFGAKLGFSTSALITALVMVQFISFPAAIAFGRLAGHIGTKRAIYLGLTVFMGLAVWAYTLQTERQFFLMAAVVALVQGGVQSLSRSYFSRLIPARQSGEYFGFYNMLGKFAAVLGPLVMGSVAVIFDNQRLSIVALMPMFALGLYLLSRVREPEPAAAP
ncbi:MAG TPA: MFS transporter [Stenotrophobium sp.]|jgi:UMF1 family MFS transporter|nr:MFS transporter [Stenotrophobium sp.]